MKKISLLSLVLGLGQGILAASSASLTPTALRVEYLKQPVSLEVAQPRLSWELDAPPTARRALRQTGYHLLVASGSVRLQPGQADLWDSGEILSDTNTHISYAGRPLGSRQVCYWSVRIRDQDGTWSAWSEPAHWTMGLLSASDWTARWIGTGESFADGSGSPPPDNTMPDPWFRQTFTLEAKPVRATAYVASVGYHELYVNGRKAGDAVLAPSVTNNAKRARYVTYDIAPLLQPGKNTIGIWLGTSWSIWKPFETADKPRAPIVLGQFELESADGQVRRIVTDETWKTHPSPNTLLGIWSFMNFGGELYDANQEVPNWAEASLDDSTWKPAKVFSPQLLVSADTIEPNRLFTPLQAVAIVAQSPGVYRIDMGRNFSGWVNLDVSGAPGDRIDFQFSERWDMPMTHRLHSAYVIGPAGHGSFQNRFNYSAGRWITIRGLRHAPALGDFRGWVVHSDYEAASAFACSNPLFNKIYATTLWTFENLTLGGYIVDCPHRERMGYGDGDGAMMTGFYGYRLGAFLTKWSQDWRDVQGYTPSWGSALTPAGQPGGHTKGADGEMPYTAPGYWGGGGPAWSGLCVRLPWEIYRQYGDRRVLADNFETIERWLQFLETKSNDNLLGRWGGRWDFLGDWLWPAAPGSVGNDTPETLFFNNCNWIHQLQLGANIARILGQSAQASAWEKRASDVRQAVHRKFFNAADHSYVNGDQAYLAIALYVHVPPEELRPVVWKRLEHEILDVRGGHIHAGIIGGSFLFKTLLEGRRDDLLHAMVSKDSYPSWGDLLRHDATTFWESWEERAGHSLMHSSYLYVGAWFMHGVLGIQPDPQEMGYKRFIIRPGPVDQPDLTWAKGHFDSIQGRIAVDWRRTGETFVLEVGVPPNTTAVIYLPTTTPESITEGDRALSTGAEVKLLRRENDRTLLEVPSGHYRFTCKVGTK